MAIANKPAIPAHVRESIGVRAANETLPNRPTKPDKNTGRRPIREIGSIDVGQVIPDPSQPRTEFDADALQRLASSIAEKGQLTPIRVRWSEEHEKWIIIAGERRWRATRLAGLKRIEAHFHDAPLDKTEILEQQIIENCLRESLTPIEEGRAFRRLIELNNWTGKQVAEALRVTPAKVSRSLALLKLPEDIQQKVDSGQIAARTGYELSKLADENQVRSIVTNSDPARTSHVAAARAVRRRTGKPKKSRKTTQSFVSATGIKVVVTSKKTSNYLELAQALEEALREINHRIDNGMQLF